MNSIDIYNAHQKMKSTSRDYNGNVSYKRNGDHTRDEVLAIRLKFPTKLPIIVERYYKEVELPHLNKRKFLVPQELTMSQFVCIIRNRMKIGQSKALFLLVNNRSMISLSRTIAEIYSEHLHDDGFLYVTYTSQEVFGTVDPDENK
ncbi:hypothetical protein HA402_008810 [Bradysia odoriphaga]|nr:hypothetical protein HA402_008810 [Bradysia odoriphaga]